MLRPSSAVSVAFSDYDDDADSIRYSESAHPDDALDFEADLSKVTVAAYDMLMPRPAEPPSRREGWGSRPSSAGTSRTPLKPKGSSAAAAKILYPGDKTRPRFLLDILTYLKSELKQLGAHAAQAGDPRRLQVYREVFERFIEEFKTYQPLLSDVKLEYEMALQLQQTELNSLYPSVSELAVQRHTANQLLENTKADAKRAMDAQLQSNHDVNRKCTVLSAELESLQREHRKLEEALQRSDARSEELVSSKIAEIRNEMHMLERTYQEELRVKDISMSDLQRAVRRTQEEKAALAAKLSFLEKTYEGMVTKADHAIVLKDLADAKADVTKLMVQVETEAAAKRRLEDEVRLAQSALKREQDNRYPDWEYVESMCPSGIQQWETLCKGKDYNDSIILLMRELVKAQATRGMARVKDSAGGMGFADSEPRFFVGLGVSASVPKHLRYKGKIRNRQISRKNLCLLLRDIWTAKAVHDSTEAAKSKRTYQRSTLPDFLYAYLKKRFGTHEIVAEFGYNIHEGAKKHQFQSVECLLFYHVLNEVYHHQQHKIERLKDLFYRLDVDLHEGKGRGIVPKADAMAAMKAHWPNKTDVQMLQLSQALDADQPGSNLTYRWLFQSDVECMFLDIVREQEMELREKYLTGLTDLFGTSLRMESQKVRTRENIGTFRLTVLDYTRGITRFDPSKPKADVDKLLSRGFGAPVAQLKSRAAIEVSAFLKNIGRNIICYGPLE
ncbi:Translin-associated factor X-interacting protein 1 [Geranomyces michiganensis]|nr:Translin-associated factor X-interacting protein 1 [Geranomyces michiganensis]